MSVPDKAGDEVGFSGWNGKDQACAILVVGDKARKLKAVIRDSRPVMPTVKFTVHKVQRDVQHGRTQALQGGALSCSPAWLSMPH